MSKTYLTKGKLKSLKKELEELKTKKRKEVADRLEWYRKSSDPEDDPQYSEILEEKSLLENRIREIERAIKTAEIITPGKNSKKKDKGVIVIGSTVTVKSEDGEDTFTIVGSLEADPTGGKISNESPVGQALIGAKVGENVDVTTPVVKKTYTIILIE